MPLAIPPTRATVSATTGAAAQTQPASPMRTSLTTRWHNFKLFGADGLNFRDVLDLINPLQHIPIVGNIYRNLTGDIAAPGIRIAGGALFGGPIGAAFAAAAVVAHQLFSSAPDVTGVPERDAPAATAIAAGPTESRGGWMVANSRAFPIATAALAHDTPASTNAPAPASATTADAPHRGGWVVQAAYGLNAIEEQRSHLFKHFHLTA